MQGVFFLQVKLDASLFGFANRGRELVADSGSTR
jgi:hypothetical protein